MEALLSMSHCKVFKLPYFQTFHGSKLSNFKAFKVCNCFRTFKLPNFPYYTKSKLQCSNLQSLKDRYFYANGVPPCSQAWVVKRPLRDDFPAQNTIWSAQKVRSKYNFICPKGPCGTLFWLKIQFDPPKSPPRDAFPAQNTIWSPQKALAGRPSVIPKADQNSIRNLFRLLL